MQIRLRSERTSAIIEVENWGVPILPSELEQIFHDGFRGALSGDRQRTGTGCSLSDTKRVVEEIGGTIKRRAYLRQAGAFDWGLTASRNSYSNSTTFGSLTGAYEFVTLSERSFEKVLWIEDAAWVDYQDLIIPIKSAGYYLSIAPDATEGLNAIRAEEFSAVIFDIRLPPGSDYLLNTLYSARERDPASAQLGLELIRGFFYKNSSHKSRGPPGLTQNSAGVFSQMLTGSSNAKCLSLVSYTAKPKGVTVRVA